MSQDAVALRIAVDNVHESLKHLYAVQKALKDIGPAAQQGARGTITAGQAMKAAAADISRAYASAAGRIRGEFSTLAGVFRNAAFAATGVAGAFAGILKVVKQFDQAEAFRRTLKLNLGDVDGLAVAGQVDRFAVRQGVNLNDARSGVQMLAGTGMGSNELMPVFEAFTALAAKSGATSEGMSRAFYQFTQIASQGKLQGDELRVIQENGVQLVRLLKESGLGDRIGSAKSPITFEEIKKALLEAAKDASTQKALEEQRAAASNSFQAALNVVQLDLIEPLGNRLGPAVVQVSDFLKDLTKDANPKVVADFVKELVTGAIDAAKWVKENQELIVQVGWTVVGFRALRHGVGLLADAMNAASAIKTLVGGAGGQAAASAVVSGAAGAGAGAAGGAAGAVVASVIRAIAVPALITFIVAEAFAWWARRKIDDFEKTHAAAAAKVPTLDDINRGRRQLGLDPVDETTMDRRNRMGYNPPQAAPPSRDALGRPIAYGITRAEQNAAFAHMMAKSLR